MRTSEEGKSSESAKEEVLNTTKADLEAVLTAKLRAQLKRGLAIQGHSDDRFPMFPLDKVRLGSSLFCVGKMHNGWFSWFGGLANRVVRGDARH
jgi:hypothetical protein